MKILLVIRSLTAGGAERQAVQDANLLSSAGHEVTISYGIAGPLLDQLNPKVHRLNLGSVSQWKSVWTLHRAIRENGSDMVFSHMFWANKVAVAACFVSGRKNVAFEHGLGLWRRWYHLLLVRWIAQRAFRVITGSEASRRIRIGREKIPSDKVTIMHNSFQPPSAAREIEVARDENRPDRFTIGFAGRFNKVKQLHLLADVAALLKREASDFRFVLLGDGDEKPVIEKMVLSRGLGDHFVFPGHVADPMPHLLAMDCFVLPSRLEEFSLALLEASYCGLPCVAFDVGGNGEIVLNGISGWLVEPYDIDEMAARIMRLKRNPHECAAMGKIASERAMALFSQEQRLQKLSRLAAEVGAYAST